MTGLLDYKDEMQVVYQQWLNIAGLSRSDTISLPQKFIPTRAPSAIGFILPKLQRPSAAT